LTRSVYLANQNLAGEHLLKAVRVNQPGGPNQLCYADAADPRIASSSDVVVKLEAASVNRRELEIRKGLFGDRSVFPHIPGIDGAGTVVAVGKAVTNVAPGDPVSIYPPVGCGQCASCSTDREFMCKRLRLPGEGENGSYAEYMSLPARNCFRFPSSLSFAEAAAVPSVYLTVWRMLFTNTQVKPGDYVLISGIGGVATAALQMSTHRGAHVIVTSRHDEKIERALTMGAAKGINSRTTDVTREVRQYTRKRGVDIVVDCVGGTSWSRNLAVLAKGGKLVTCGALSGGDAASDLRRIFWNNLTICGSSLGSRAEFKQVLDFLDTARVKPIIDRVYPLKDANQAQQRMEEGQQFGKIVLTMDG